MLLQVHVPCPRSGLQMKFASEGTTSNERERHGHLGPDDWKEARVLRAVGLGLITGAADDDPSAITTRLLGDRAGVLRTAPVTLPMMFAVVYLSAKLGQVSGKGLFAVIRDHYSPRLLWVTLVGVMIGNMFEAAADLGGMAAALHLFVPWHLIPRRTDRCGDSRHADRGSYELIRNVFRWLSLGPFRRLICCSASGEAGPPGRVSRHVHPDDPVQPGIPVVARGRDRHQSVATCTPGNRIRRSRKRLRWAGAACVIALERHSPSFATRGATS